MSDSVAHSFSNRDAAVNCGDSYPAVATPFGEVYPLARAILGLADLAIVDLIANAATCVGFQFKAG